MSIIVLSNSNFGLAKCVATSTSSKGLGSCTFMRGSHVELSREVRLGRDQPKGKKLGINKIQFLCANPEPELIV